MNIKGLIKRTGLKDPFIRKCLRELREVIEPHITKGENNAIDIDDNGLAIFDQIAQYKEQNISLPEMRKRFEPLIVKRDIKPKQDEKIESALRATLEAEKARYKAEKERDIAKFELEHLRSNLKSLPAPDQLKEIAHLTGMLEGLTSPRLFKGKQTRKAWERLRELLDMKVDENPQGD